jgi:Pentapeptide repeats (8 copies)
MNDAADEPSKPTSAEPEFREITKEELERILADHQRWMEAEEKTSLDHLRAHLPWAYLRGLSLDGARLQEAMLFEAQLQGAVLSGAQLQGTDLGWAHLEDADLSGAQLQGTDLREAQLHRANLERAQLQGARLFRAYLREVILIGANLERLEIKKDGEPGQERSADLTDADFRDADLSNAQLSTVNGLRAEMLAGAVLTNAKLPEEVARFDQLKHVEETSRNATTVFFGLRAASLYSWLTIATTTDVALITGTASSPLPIINTNIALSGFYLAAPLILIAVYFYFHLYLQRLWGDLATLPAVFPDGAPLDRKAYPCS